MHVHARRVDGDPSVKHACSAQLWFWRQLCDRSVIKSFDKPFIPSSLSLISLHAHLKMATSARVPDQASLHSTPALEPLLVLAQPEDRSPFKSA